MGWSNHLYCYVSYLRISKSNVYHQPPHSSYDYWIVSNTKKRIWSLNLIWSGVPFYTSWQLQKTYGFVMFSGGIKGEHGSSELTHFRPLLTFYTPWNHRKNFMVISTIANDDANTNTSKLVCFTRASVESQVSLELVLWNRRPRKQNRNSPRIFIKEGGFALVHVNFVNFLTFKRFIPYK